MSLTIGTQTVNDQIGTAAGWEFVSNQAGYTSANLKIYNASADQHTFEVIVPDTANPGADLSIRKIQLGSGESATFSTNNLADPADPAFPDPQYCQLRLTGGGNASTVSLNYALNVN